MADRVRDIAKKSGSRLHVGRGSINHIGAAPYRFKLDVFISYVDNIKSATEVCVTWERKGKIEATAVAKVKDKKAVFRQCLTMEVTLFRRDAAGEGNEVLKFDEKRAKFQLRKGGADGKAIGKLAMNLAEYVRGTNSTVFADMKLSNDSVIVTKIEATMLHVGRKKKGAGSRTGSEACSEMTDLNTIDDDSLFGDDDQDLGDMEIATTAPPPEFTDKNSNTLSPVSSTMDSALGSIQEKSFAANKGKEMGRIRGRVEGVISTESSKKISGSHSAFSLSTSRRLKKSVKGPKVALKEDEGLKNSLSLKDKIKGKIKGKKDRESKGKEADAENDDDRVNNKLSIKEEINSRMQPLISETKIAENAELKAAIDSLKKENTKLKKAKQAAMDEIEALRTDLKACEVALEEAKADKQVNGNAAVVPALDVSRTLKEKDRKIAELEAQNESLLDELEELHENAVDSAIGVVDGQMNALKRRIEELEIALKREPQFMDVVNELKVTKVSLALANMEKEQALFALQSCNAAVVAGNKGGLQ